ncbi:MAG: metal-dependent hydrolase [Lautropia sp.]
MDPLAHTLFGAALAESGLKHRARYATASLLIGANLPDIDGLANWWGSDVALGVRRGHTHGILAILLLPLVLTAGLALWHRWRGQTDPIVGAPPWRPRTLLALSALAVASHPLLDWLNTYGVRLLMPFDGRWFYGDTLFIIDPWFWLLTAAGVVLARSADRRAIAGWVVLAVLASALVLGTGLVPIAVKWIWCLGVVGLVALRARRPAHGNAQKAAQNASRLGLAALALYIGVAYGLARLAESGVSHRSTTSVSVQANPMPGVPFAHRLVVTEGLRYRIEAADGTVHELPRRVPDAVVQEAMRAPSVRGFMNWTRFPYWTVEEAADHWTVRFIDLRYQGPDLPDARGIGAVQVVVPKGR